MSADQGRWFKLWVSALNDPDLRNLPIEDFGRWCIFGAYLKLHGHDGRITLREPALALQELLRLPSFEAVVKILASFPNCNATPVTTASVTVDVEWLNWQRYQGDYCGDRVRRYRDKKRTLSNGPISDSVTGIEEKRREEKRRDKKRVRTEAVAAPTLIQFRLPASVSEALDRAPKLGADRRIRTPVYWQALVRAHGGVDYGHEVLKAEAWMVANPARAPRKNLARFLATWIGRAERPEEDAD